MLKREIVYEDWDGNKAVEICYFNLTKPELIDMEVEHDDQRGFAAFLEKIVETKDQKELIRQFKKIVLMAYGVKSEDGKRFIKSDQLREEFSQTAAYPALFMELATNDMAAVDFFRAVMPKDMMEAFDQAQVELPKPDMTPPKPPTPPSV